MDKLVPGWKRFHIRRAPSCSGRCAGNGCTAWGARTGDKLPARSRAGGIQHWRDDSVAGFQRHVASGGMGTSSDNLGGILAVADWVSRTGAVEGEPALTMKQLLGAMIKAHEIRDALRWRIRSTRLAGSCCFGEGGVDGGGVRAAGPESRTNPQCNFTCLGGRTEPADISTCAEHWFEEKLGCG